jgi:hypothetical protein
LRETVGVYTALANDLAALGRRNSNRFSAKRFLLTLEADDIWPDVGEISRTFERLKKLLRDAARSSRATEKPSWAKKWNPSIP